VHFWPAATAKLDRPGFGTRVGRAWAAQMTPRGCRSTTLSVATGLRRACICSKESTAASADSLHGRGVPVKNELVECWGGPLDGQAVRLRPGQYELSVPLQASPASESRRRYAVYSVRKKRLRSGHVRERVVRVLMFAGEEWRVA
jgi:hypothetical protein